VVSSRIQVKYDVVHNLVHEKLKADKKVAQEQEPGAVENFKKELAQKISVFKEEKQSFKRVRYWCEDENWD